MTTRAGVATVSNMKTVLLLDERRAIAEDRFVELVYADFMADVSNWRT